MDARDITSIISTVAQNYQYRKTPEIVLLYQELVAKIKRMIADLLSLLHVQMPGSPANTHMVGNTMQVLLLLAGVLALGALLFVSWRRMTTLSAQALRARRGQADEEVELDADGWRAQATRLADSAQYKQACRAAYFSVIKRLDEKAVLEFVPTRTNYEYWYALSRHKEIALLFRQLADVVESCWFGNRTAGGAEYNDCIRLVSSAESEIEKAHTAALAIRTGAPSV